MPSSYTHYRFGTQVLPMMPADVRRPAERCRTLFDAGLQGPDPFYFYKPAKTPLEDMALQYHRQSGQQFFSRSARLLRENPSEEGFAYLYGLLGHYCLDSVCHPYIHEQTDTGPISHNRLETEFEWFLLEKDGNKKPYAYDRSVHVKLSKEESRLVAEFFPPVTAEQTYEAFDSTNRILRLLTCRNAVHRGLAAKVLKAMGGQQPGLLMGTAPDPACGPHNQVMLELYQEALARYPVLLEQLCSHIAYQEPLGDAFIPDFG